MPIYEYKCTSCDYSFEERQGFDAEPVCVCPQCQNSARRLFRPAPIIFKGKGFYVTDYPNGSASTSQNTSEESAGNEPRKEPDTKTESKPETSPATASKSADE